MRIYLQVTSANDVSCSLEDHFVVGGPFRSEFHRGVVTCRELRLLFNGDATRGAFISAHRPGRCLVISVHVPRLTCRPKGQVVKHAKGGQVMLFTFVFGVCLTLANHRTLRSVYVNTVLRRGASVTLFLFDQAKADYSDRGRYRPGRVGGLFRVQVVDLLGHATGRRGTKRVCGCFNG